MEIVTRIPNSKKIFWENIKKIILIFRLCYSITFDISMNTPIEWWQSCYLMSCMNYKCFTWISWINSWKIYEHMNMNRGKSMNPWIWICPKAVNPWISNAINLWTHELHLLKIHEPVNMNTYIALNSWIWILNFPWTREYEHGNVAPWTFKSSYSSRNSMNHPMNTMNCNAWINNFLGGKKIIKKVKK